MIVVTHPGRFGDLLWALPTARLLAEAYGAPVHLHIPAQYDAIAPLLRQQPYLASVLSREDWQVEQTAPITPRQPPAWQTATRPDRVFHLGYRGWPQYPLPLEVHTDVAAHQWRDADGVLPALDLTRPWITATSIDDAGSDCAVGFTEEHFELKYGIWSLLINREPRVVGVGAPTDPGRGFISLCTSPRWQQEADHGGADWPTAASWISASKVFLGCCSALHVLAVALGVPAVVMEPNPHRLHPIFWPLGTDGPQVTLVKGLDGQATWDARHTAETIARVLAARGGR